MKKDLDAMIAERELIETSIRKRHQDAVNEMNQQVENINKQRNKSVTVMILLYCTYLFMRTSNDKSLSVLISRTLRQIEHFNDLRAL